MEGRNEKNHRFSEDFLTIPIISGYINLVKAPDGVPPMGGWGLHKWKPNGGCDTAMGQITNENGMAGGWQFQRKDAESICLI